MILLKHPSLISYILSDYEIFRRLILTFKTISQ